MPSRFVLHVGYGDFGWQSTANLDLGSLSLNSTVDLSQYANTRGGVPLYSIIGGGGTGISIGQTTGVLTIASNASLGAGYVLVRLTNDGNTPEDKQFGFTVASVGFNAVAPYNVVPATSYVDGASITITGSGFGTMGGDVLQWATGNEYPNGTQINGATPTIGSAFSTFLIGTPDWSRLVYSSANARVGRTAALRRYHTGPASGTYQAGGFGWGGTATPTLFISYWRYDTMPSFNTPLTSNYKHLYVFGNGVYSSSSDSPPSTPMMVPAGSSTYYTYANIGGVTTPVSNGANTAGWTAQNQAGAWYRLDMHMKLNSSANSSDGISQNSINGVMGIDEQDWNWWGTGFTTPPTGWKNVWVGYMDLNMDGFIADHNDLYIATTQARVEISDSPTWGTSATKDIQIARNAHWSDTSITAQLNFGASASLTGKYLYVVKSDGTAINIGSFN